jgi:hypothetical protein
LPDDHLLTQFTSQFKRNDFRRSPTQQQSQLRTVSAPRSVGRFRGLRRKLFPRISGSIFLRLRDLGASSRTVRAGSEAHFRRFGSPVGVDRGAISWIAGSGIIPGAYFPIGSHYRAAALFPWLDHGEEIGFSAFRTVADDPHPWRYLLSACVPFAASGLPIGCRGFTSESSHAGFPRRKHTGAAKRAWAKIYMAKDAMLLNRTDATLVRVTTKLGRDENKARQLAVSFAELAIHNLDQIIPK